MHLGLETDISQEVLETPLKGTMMSLYHFSKQDRWPEVECKHLFCNSMQHFIINPKERDSCLDPKYTCFNLKQDADAKF